MKSNPRNHLPHIACAIAFAALAAGGAPAQGPPPAPADPGFEVYLWIDDGFALDEAAIARIRDLGVNGIDAEGPEGVAKAGRSGLPFYVDHAVPKGFLHLRRDTFEAAREKWRKEPAPVNLRRPVCLRDPKALAQAALDLGRTLEACAAFKPRFLSFTDEPSVTRGINPIDWCRDEFCAEALPKFLARRWGSPALAREAWASRWPKDGPPVPVDTDEARRALFHEVGPLATVACWDDTRAFAESALADAFAHLSAEARRIRPGLRVALLGASMPSAFGGFDWEQLAPLFDAFEPYDWGAAHALARSCAPQADLYHTLTTDRAGPAAVQHELWRYFLRGDRGVILFDASAWTSTPALASIAPLLQLFQSADLADWRKATPLKPQVAILHGMASTRLLWLLDTRYDGATWFNRLSSYEAAESSEALNREAWTAVLSDLGLSWRFVTPRQVRDGSFLDDGTTAVVLPRAIAMSSSEAEAIAACATRYFVIADCQTALFDARLQKRDQGALDELFGIGRPRLRSVDDFVSKEPESRPGTGTAAAEPLLVPRGATPSQASGTAPLVLVRAVGANRTVYLNMRIGSYVRNRITDPEAAERLRAVLRPLFVTGRVRPRFEVAQLDPGPRWPFAVHARKLDRELLIAVELAATTGARPIDWSGPIGTAAPRIAITLPGTFRVTNLLTGDSLGPLNAIETPVTATRPVLFRLAP